MNIKPHVVLLLYFIIECSQLNFTNLKTTPVNAQSFLNTNR